MGTPSGHGKKSHRDSVCYWESGSRLKLKSKGYNSTLNLIGISVVNVSFIQVNDVGKRKES